MFLFLHHYFDAKIIQNIKKTKTIKDRTVYYQQCNYTLQKREICICHIFHDVRVASDVSEHLQEPRPGCPQVTECVKKTVLS